MNNLNKVLVEGRLTRDPELEYINDNTGICKMGMAVNRSWKKGDEWQEEVSYLDIVVWGKQGESCANFLTKGRIARVEGRLKQDRWVSKEGQNRSKVQIVADHVEFGPKPKGQEGPAEDEDIPF
jgi:single-strand DNA-binding protein